MGWRDNKNDSRITPTKILNGTLREKTKKYVNEQLSFNVSKVVPSIN